MRPEQVSATIASRETSRVAASSIATVLAVVLGAFVVLSTLYGVHRFYSPIPYMDEWDGYLGFYFSSLEGGGFHNWWDNHMEHRLITSRALFWLDLRFFHGNHVLLFAATLMLLAAIVFVVARSSTAPRAWTIGLGCAFVFAWVQREMLVWGFETQIVAAYFFSILACALFCQFEKPVLFRFSAAYVAAILAEFSMANGLGVYAVIFGATILARRPMAETIAAAAMATVLVAVYFIGYTAPPSDMASASHGIMRNAVFLFLFMANPLALAGVRFPMCIAIGAATLSVAMLVSLRICIKREATSYRTFLICVYAFVFLSAVAVTRGRSAGGLEAGVAGRYTTGPLIAWWALALLLFDYVESKAARSAVMILAVGLAARISVGQLKVLDDNSYLYNWKLGILSNRIGMERKDFTSLLFPQDGERAARFESRTVYASVHHIGYYGRQWLRDAGEVKFDPSKLGSGWCEGYLESIASDAHGMVASGWAKSPSGNDALIVLTNPAGETVGYGVTGMRRDDVRKVVPDAPALPGWIGFTKAGASISDAYVYANGSFCKLGHP